MDEGGRKMPGADALGDFDVSDLQGRLSLGELRELTPSTKSYVDLMPEAPKVLPPPWWENAAPGTPGAVPNTAQELSAGAKWVRDNLGPSSVQWWYRENYTQIPNTADLSLLLGNEYTVPSGQALAILNVTPMVFGSIGVSGETLETGPLALQFMTAFRMTIAGRSSLDVEHTGPAFGGGTSNRWDTGVVNQPMYWGNSSVRVTFTLYAREGEKVRFELIGPTTMASIRSAINTQLTSTSAFAGYRATGVLIPMSYLF